MNPKLNCNAGSGCPDTTCYVSADYLLENSWSRNIEGWYEATKDGKHRQFVRVRLDIGSLKYVLDVVGQDRKHSEELWRYKGGDWLFLSHNVQMESANPPKDVVEVASHDLLSVEEMAATAGLVEAWNAWVKLESLHPDETTEFCRAIHAAQHIIMARPVQRKFNSDNA